MKYIVFSQTFDTGVTREVPVVFPNCLTHSLVAQSMLTNKDELKGATVVSAGFIELETFTTHGESVSLGIKSRQEDSLLINMHDYWHGLV